MSQPLETRRGRMWLVLALSVVALACSPEEPVDDPVTTLGSTAPVSRPEAAATTVTNPGSIASPGATSTGPEFGPKEVALQWSGCTETQGAQLGDLTFSCSAGRLPQVPEFTEGYLNGYVNFETNEQDEIVAVAISASGYNGSCFWNKEGPDWEAPLEEGQAVIEGVLIGTDRCDGYQFSFVAVWDEDTLEFSMDGAVEPLP